MKPTATAKSGETAFYGGRAKRQYMPGKKSLMKRRRAKADRRVAAREASAEGGL